MLMVILVIIIMLSLDSLFAWLSIPVVSMDLMLLGLSLVLLIIVFKVRVKFSDLIKVRAAVSLSVWKRLGYIVFLLLLVGTGLYLTLEGIKHPLQLFTGVKGSSHGYTVSVLGVLITFYSSLGLLIIFPRRKSAG